MVVYHVAIEVSVHFGLDGWWEQVEMDNRVVRARINKSDGAALIYLTMSVSTSTGYWSQTDLCPHKTGVKFDVRLGDLNGIGGQASRDRLGLLLL